MVWDNWGPSSNMVDKMNWYGWSGDYPSVDNIGMTASIADLAFSTDAVADDSMPLVIGGTMTLPHTVYLNYKPVGTATDVGFTGSLESITVVGANSAPAVPEPLTVLATLTGLCGLGGYIRKRRLA